MEESHSYLENNSSLESHSYLESNADFCLDTFTPTLPTSTTTPTTPRVVNCKKEIYKYIKDDNHLLQTLIKQCKIITYEHKKSIFDKNTSDVIEDLKETDDNLTCLDSKVGLNNNFSNVELKNLLFRDQIVSKQIQTIPLFLDFAYMYFVNYLDNTSPVYKLPMTVFKLNLINYYLTPSTTTPTPTPITPLHNLFKQCVENPFIKEVRNELIPFHITTDMPKEEILDKLREIQPIMKSILDGLLRLPSRS